MHKKFLFLMIISMTLNACGQKNMILFSKSENTTPVINIPLRADASLEKNANYFVINFQKLTGENLKIERSDGFNENNTYISLRINPTLRNEFCIQKSDKNIVIQATDNDNLNFAISDFFQRFTVYNPDNLISKTTDSIVIPERFNDCASPDFKYREPYFSPNFKANFRKWHKTNYLELEWGIWGHNLPKKLKKYNLDNSVYAKIGKERNIEQFCFTSDTLFKYVNLEIDRIHKSDNNLDKYMILPNDNDLVCTCESCKNVGNTENDTSPAVFDFLNRLSKNHKNLNFFTTAYVTVKTVPKSKVNKNIGVFISTIDIQKGIPIANSRYFENFKLKVTNWKNKVDNIYIWDYAVNFDNYLDIYPSILTTQQNLKLYKNLGIKGVFIHGSEYNYGTFQDLKTVLFSKLLWDVNTNVSEEIAGFFSARYSSNLASLLTNYYMSIEKSFISNKNELDIYSGIDESVEKYLNPEEYFKFYKEFINYKTSNQLNEDYSKLATGLTFLKLEIMRTQGLEKFGYAELNKENEIVFKNDVDELLNELNLFSKKSNIKTFNEVNYTIEDYIKSWREKINNNNARKNFFYKKPFKVISKKDEDYTRTSILNDGAFGLEDYNTNWHIVSIDDLTLRIQKSDISESKQVTVSFLQDKKHSIYFPSKIEFLTDNFQLIKEIVVPESKDQRSIKEINLELPKALEEKQLSDNFIMKITRSNYLGKNLLATDEIIFN